MVTVKSLEEMAAHDEDCETAEAESEQRRRDLFGIRSEPMRQYLAEIKAERMQDYGDRPRPKHLGCSGIPLPADMQLQAPAKVRWVMFETGDFWGDIDEIEQENVTVKAAPSSVLVTRHA